MAVRPLLTVSLTIWLTSCPFLIALLAAATVSWKSFIAGFIKSVAFGFIAAWAGCYRGHVARRSALGVGEAATSAAVLGITLIVIADAVFAVIFNLYGI